MGTFQEIMDRLKDLKGLTNDIEVAELLGVSQAAFTSRKKRNSPPLEEISIFCDRQGISLEYILFGKGPIIGPGCLDIYPVMMYPKNRELWSSRVPLVDKESYITSEGLMSINDLLSRLGMTRQEFEDWFPQHCRWRERSIDWFHHHFERYPYIAGKCDWIYFGILQYVFPGLRVDDYFEIPLMSGQFAEDGRLLRDAQSAFRTAFRKDLAYLKGNREKMYLIPMHGDTMEPTIMQGDVVLVDHNITEPHREGGIYAIKAEDGLMIRRIQFNPQSSEVTIISDNGKYASHLSSKENINFFGKVIWFARALEK